MGKPLEWGFSGGLRLFDFFFLGGFLCAQDAEDDEEEGEEDKEEEPEGADADSGQGWLWWEF